MPSHVIVDGSNLATEGRAMPSLHQLNEAVMAFIAEHPDALITVVVDATFGHRISSSEVAEFDDAVSNNELVAPPAGAIGRGDAFLLSIANKVGATVLSNDSFQEFHGTYPWLFDEGRLIGGKPVPHIGWVFVARTPVRGPISRSAVKEARRKKDGGVALPLADRGGRGRRDKRAPMSSPEASRPMPVPKAPPPNATIPGAKPAAPQKAPSTAKPDAAPDRPAASAATAVNDFTSFLSFVEHHPIGTSVNAIVETYSSHGAYVKLDGGVVGYVPLRLMSDPPPRSAREFMKIGDAVTLVVESFAPARRSIDLATTSMAKAVPPAAPAKRARKVAASADATAGEAPEKKPSRRKKAAPATEPTSKDAQQPDTADASVATPVDPGPAATAPAATAPAETGPAETRPAETGPAEKPSKTPRPAKAAKAAKSTGKAAKTTTATKAVATSGAHDEPAGDAGAAASEKPAKASRSKKKAPAEVAAPTPALGAASAGASDSAAAVRSDDAPAKKAPRRTKKAAGRVASPGVDPAAENAASIDGAPASVRPAAGDAGRSDAAPTGVDPAAENAASIDAVPAAGRSSASPSRRRRTPARTAT
jgi:hypothetical protein